MPAFTSYRSGVLLGLAIKTPSPRHQPGGTAPSPDDLPGRTSVQWDLSDDHHRCGGSRYRLHVGTD